MPNWFRLLPWILFVPLLVGMGPGLAADSPTDNPGVVKGTVQSAESNKPLPGANVAVRRAADSTLVDGTTTDSTGHFIVRALPTGRYVVEVSFMGYAPRSRTVTLTADTPTRTLDPFQLADTTARMDGATVSSERTFVTTKGSKRIYNVEKSQVAVAGKSTVDLLRNLPSLWIDAMDGTIQLRGNQSVSIHVNGEPVSMSGKALVQYLKSLSARDVERVEINTNPSARHDAEGTAGIVNIVLDRTENRGLSGGGAVSAGMGPRLDGSGHLGYQQKPWTLYGSYTYTHHEHERAATLLRHSRDDASILLLKQSANQTDTHGGHTFNAEIDYALTPKTTLSLTSTGNVRRGGERQNMTTRRASWEPSRTREVNEDDRSVHLDERLSLSHEFSKQDHKWTADLRYQRDEERDRVREERVPAAPREQETTTEEEHDASLKLDYTRPQGEWTIETGYKGGLRHLDQRYKVLHADPEAGDFSGPPAQSDALTFREQIHAGYVTLQRPVGPFDAEAGLRIEHTRTTLSPSAESSASNRYTDLFPSASLTYKMGKERRVSLSYSKRIDRPHSHQLNAFNASSNPYVRFVGNPNLEPEYIHKAELTVMQKIGPATITVTPYGRRKTNAIGRATVQNDSVTARTYDNYDTRTSYGAELTSSLKVGAVKARLSGNLYHRSTRGGPLGKDTRTALAVMGRGNVTWTLREGLRLQVSQMYRSPVNTGLGRLDSFVRTRASLEHTFWDGKGSLGLRVRDPFNTSEMGFRKQTDHFRERMTRDWDGRTVSLSFSYQFGDGKKKRRRQSSGGGGMGMGGG
ncbi:MAG: TonB-dependent receptor domain-containing protein [Salinibacter sp.]